MRRGVKANKGSFRTSRVKTKKVAKKDSAGWFYDKRGNVVHVMTYATVHVKGKK